MCSLSVDCQVDFGSQRWTLISSLMRICDSKSSPPIWHPCKLSIFKWLRSLVIARTEGQSGTYIWPVDTRRSPHIAPSTRQVLPKSAMTSTSRVFKCFSCYSLYSVLLSNNIEVNSSFTISSQQTFVNRSRPLTSNNQELDHRTSFKAHQSLKF